MDNDTERWIARREQLETDNKKLEAENKELKKSLLWLQNDMAYKAPEQVFELLCSRWIPYIVQALKGVE